MEHIGIFLRDIFLKKNRGRLSFFHQNIQKYLFFQNGFLVYAKTNHPQELLGEVLFRLGKLSKEEFEKIDEYIQPRKSIGAVLIEKGLIAKESLHEGLIYQMREIVLNMFPVFDAEFKFQDEVDLSEQEFDVKLKVTTLIEEGIRGMKHHPALETFLSKQVPFSKSIDFYLRLTEQERKLFDLIKGKSSAEELMNRSGLESDFFWKSLYLLYCLNLVDFKKELGREENVSAAPENEESKVEEAGDDRVSEIMEFYKNLDNLDYYQILGVKKGDSPDEAKKAYFKLARKFHPDLFGRNLPPETLQMVDEVFDQVTKAYNTLSDGKRKREYEEQQKSPVADTRRNQAKEADKRFRQGKTLYDQSRYEEALVFLEQAVRLSQDSAKYFLLLAMTQAKLHVYRKEAEKNFIRATKLEPWNAEAFAGLGLMYKREGLHIKAKKQFERALQIDPDHRIAKKELYGENRPKTKGGLKDLSFKSLLKKDFFGKKKNK
jgi:curved DNA-binding protein CbpA